MEEKIEKNSVVDVYTQHTVLNLIPKCVFSITNIQITASRSHLKLAFQKSSLFTEHGRYEMKKKTNKITQCISVFGKKMFGIKA